MDLDPCSPPLQKKKIMRREKRIYKSTTKQKREKNNRKLPFIPNLDFGRYENPNWWP